VSRTPSVADPDAFTVNVGTSAAPIAAAGVRATEGYVVKADVANGAGIVYLGGTDVDATDGFPLAVISGQPESVSVTGAKLAKMSAIGSTSGLKLKVLKL
jgi:hypothetical protein